MAKNFNVGSDYTRDEIYELLAVPTDKRLGNWETGYNRWGDDLHIFCNVGASGRSGHYYDNRWLDDDRFKSFFCSLGLMAAMRVLPDDLYHRVMETDEEIVRRFGNINDYEPAPKMMPGMHHG